MSPGDRVDAVVTRVEPYALYLAHVGEAIIVLAPDVSQARPLDLPSTFHVGDTLTVHILRYIPEKAVYKASMVEVPETEPRLG